MIGNGLEVKTGMREPVGSFEMSFLLENNFLLPVSRFDKTNELSISRRICAVVLIVISNEMINNGTGRWYGLISVDSHKFKKGGSACFRPWGILRFMGLLGGLSGFRFK